MTDLKRKYLDDIYEAIVRIEFFIGEPKTFEKYQNNLMLRQAVERNIEIIGEALHRLLRLVPEIAISNSRKIVDTRNRIIHGYDQVEDVVVWSIIIKHLPILKAEVAQLKSNYE
jgi:uncharacterized protein with HEPN domain